MTIVKILAIAFSAILMGMKAIYGYSIIKDKNEPLHYVWKKKTTYFLALVWTAFSVGIEILTAKDMLAVRMADLLGNYLILALIDWKKRIVPDKILLGFLAGQMLLAAASASLDVIGKTAFFGAAASGIFLVLSLLFKGSLGMGDAKLLGITAMTAGTAYALFLFSAGLILSVFYGIWLVAFKKKSVKTEVPFVPFLAAAAAMHMMITIV